MTSSRLSVRHSSYPYTWQSQEFLFHSSPVGTIFPQISQICQISRPFSVQNFFLFWFPFSLQWLPQSLILCCLFYFLFVMLSDFFKAGYPALVINPVCNSLCHASFSLVSCSYWEQWDGQRAMDTRGMTGYADYHVSSHVSCRVGHWVIVKQEF